MISRRKLLTGVAAHVIFVSGPLRNAMASLAAAEPVAFRIARKGDPIGRHTVTFSRDGADLTVSVAVEIDVWFGPIRFYRYRHSATERWQDGTFVALEAKTDDNGDDYRVTVARVADGLRVSGSKGTFLAPPEAHAATHWNRRQLDGPLINTQTGELMRPEVSVRGIEMLGGSNGRSIEATRYTLSGDAAFDLWYDGQDRWVGLAFTGKDGADIRYGIG